MKTGSVMNYENIKPLNELRGLQVNNTPKPKKLKQNQGVVKLPKDYYNSNPFEFKPFTKTQNTKTQNNKPKKITKKLKVVRDKKSQDIYLTDNLTHVNLSKLPITEQNLYHLVQHMQITCMELNSKKTGIFDLMVKNRYDYNKTIILTNGKESYSYIFEFGNVRVFKVNDVYK